MHAQELNVRLAFIGDTQSSAYFGTMQGLDEANLQGQFLGQSYELKTLSPSAASSAKLNDVQAVVVGADENVLFSVSKQYPDLPVFNVTNTDDELRHACAGNLLHVIPSDKILADADAQWQKKNPGSSARAQAWHYDFKKFAARDLNKRFKKARGIQMDDHAWAGWAAVKMLTDTVAREKITAPEKLLAYLKTELAFDGQKGIRMTFRPTGQLRQPVLLIENDKIVGQAPVRGVAKPPTVESLGILDCEK
ncbi:MAG: hypothetical protein MI673_02590 [Thiotrichales bacterium]|nr:hypothetical protein [Thiotrichales bacterium]